LIKIHNYSILKDVTLFYDLSIIFLMASIAASLVFAYADTFLNASLIELAVTTRDFLFINGAI
jgi:uncharacterized membrane protein (DUF485 family)